MRYLRFLLIGASAETFDYLVSKRVVDLGLATVAAVLLAPVMLLTQPVDLAHSRQGRSCSLKREWVEAADVSAATSFAPLRARPSSAATPNGLLPLPPG